MLKENIILNISYNDYGIQKNKKFFTLTTQDFTILYLRTSSVIQKSIIAPNNINIDSVGAAMFVAVEFIKETVKNVTDIEFKHV